MRRYLQRLVMRNAIGTTANAPTPLLPNRPKAEIGTTDDPFENEESALDEASAPSSHADAFSLLSRSSARDSDESLAPRALTRAESDVVPTDPVAAPLGIPPVDRSVQQPSQTPVEQEAPALKPAPAYSLPDTSGPNGSELRPVAPNLSKRAPESVLSSLATVSTGQQARKERLTRQPGDLASPLQTMSLLGEGLRQVPVVVDYGDELRPLEALPPYAKEQAWGTVREQELRPQATASTPAAFPQPDQPRVVIGRLSVEVVPESPQPPESVASLPAQSARVDSAHDETGRSMLRFGLGQL